MFTKISILTNNTTPDLGVYTEMTNEHFDYNTWANHKGDNFRSLEFNKHIYRLMPHKHLHVLEIGCGDGSATASFIEHGHSAVGLDLYSRWQEFRINGWGKHPDSFFLCDAGKDFSLVDEDKQIVKFDLIFSYECFEHIPNSDIAQLARNLAKHSHSGTYLIFGVSEAPCDSHRSLHDKRWWVKNFQNTGFQETRLDFGHDVIRDIQTSAQVYMIFANDIMPPPR